MLRHGWGTFIFGSEEEGNRSSLHYASLLMTTEYAFDLLRAIADWVPAPNVAPRREDLVR